MKDTKQLTREQVVLWAYESGFPTNYARNEVTRFETFARLVEKHVNSELYKGSCKTKKESK